MLVLIADHYNALPAHVARRMTGTQGRVAYHSAAASSEEMANHFFLLTEFFLA